MSQVIGKVRQMFCGTPLLSSLTPRSTDPSSLLPDLASCLPRCTHHTLPRPPRFAHRHPPHGQAQTDLGSLNRLWRLCRRDRLQRCVCDGEKDGAEKILQADYAAGGAEEYKYGADDTEVGRGGGLEEGGEGDVAEE